MKQRQVNRIISKCITKARKKKKKCIVENCINNAVNSHVLWKAGILQPISTNSHLMEINSQKWTGFSKPEFVSTGLNKILSFTGFCSCHDSELFKSIENWDVDFTHIRNQILVSIRGLAHENRKKEINIDFFKSILKENIFLRDMLENQIHMHNLGIKDFDFYIDELSKEYVKSTGKFVFKYYEIDTIIPIVASTVFSVDSFKTMGINHFTKNNWESEPLNTVIFNFFPFNGKSITIIGFPSTFLENLNIINKINSYSKEDFMKLISDILIQRVESWACSFEFYNRCIKPNEKRILSEFQNFESRDFNGSLSSCYNLFQNWN